MFYHFCKAVTLLIEDQSVPCVKVGCYIDEVINLKYGRSKIQYINNADVQTKQRTESAGTDGTSRDLTVTAVTLHWNTLPLG